VDFSRVGDAWLAAGGVAEMEDEAVGSIPAPIGAWQPTSKINTARQPKIGLRVRIKIDPSLSLML
jgi:hypothetical protein